MDTALNINQPDSLLSGGGGGGGHLVMFHRAPLEGQAGLEHELDIGREMSQ